MNETARVTAVLLPWMPVARERRTLAARSPSDSARWNDLITGVEGPGYQEATEGNFQAVAELTRDARTLLTALRDTQPPRVPVAEVADRIRRLLDASARPPRARLSVQALVAQTECPEADVKLALDDLAVSGHTQRVHRAWRTRGTPTDVGSHRATMVTEFLRALIATGAYPRGSQMPTQPVLARILVVPLPAVSTAVAQLAADGELIALSRRRTVVRSGDALEGRRLYPAPNASAITALPTVRDTGAVPSLKTQHVVQKRACYHWRRLIEWPPGDMETQTACQHAVLRRLALDATAQMQSRSVDEQQPTWAVIAHAMACATIPQRDALDQRLWRMAVLCTAVTNLHEHLTQKGDTP